MELVMADQGDNSVMREYRKGNWTLNETMVLIEAKKMDDERRMKRIGEGEGRGKPTELRWKWVEDYCWRKECFRSQNQCNDKWDNLMRDYKKVREYEKRISERGKGEGNSGGSYWEMEKNERKERNLPSNMSLQIYEALVEVVERKGGQRVAIGAGGSGTNPNIGFVKERPMSSVQPSLSPLLQHQTSAPFPAVVLPLPAPPPPPQPAVTVALAPPQAQPLPLPYSHALPTMCDSSDSDTSEYSDSPAKRRRRGDKGEGTSTAAAAAAASTTHEVGTAISEGASIIAEALHACQEREERRHRDLLSLHERRLRIEESKTQISREGINGLVDAINKLANSILALASHRNQSAPK